MIALSIKALSALIDSDSVSSLYSLMTGMSNSHQDLLHAIITIYTRIGGKCTEIELIWICRQYEKQWKT